jgi:hypothetical protein
MAFIKTDKRTAVPPILNDQKTYNRISGRKDLSRDDQYTAEENRIRKKFTAATATLPMADMPVWLVQFSEARMVPKLAEIGIEPELSRALFKMAAPAWEHMGPIDAKTIYFHPALMWELMDIRSGYLNASRQNSEKRRLLATMNSRDRFEMVEESTDPRHLFHMLEEIATSWIILPRAFGHLEEKHARWLPGYLESLEKDGRSAFANILIRIIIEFVGNFALKFSRADYPRKVIEDTLFYGYAAMFWKNLRSPPQGVENAMVFENFLRWTQLFCKRCPPTSSEKTGTLAIMEKTSKKVSAVKSQVHCM